MGIGIIAPLLLYIAHINLLKQISNLPPNKKAIGEFESDKKRERME